MFFLVACPQRAEGIQCIDETANVLRVSENHLEKISKIGHLANVLELNIHDILTCRKRTATATARRLIRLKYPEPNEGFRLADVDDGIIDAIIRKFYFLL